MSNLALKRDQAIQEIIRQTAKKGGAFWKMYHGEFDVEGFNALVEAVMTYSECLKNGSAVDRRVAACLFEAPWEIENSERIYGVGNPELGRLIKKTAQQVREAIHDMLWNDPKLNDLFDW